VNAADRPAYDTDRLDTLSPRVLGDGAVDMKYVRLQSG
jgi:hypothetical protein